MKKIAFILLTIIGLGLLFSCEKELKDPKLDNNQTTKPVISNPADGSAFVLLKANADSLLTEFQWSPAQYNLTNLENTKYILQMDLAGNNFASPISLISTTGTAFGITVFSMNNSLLILGLNFDEAHSLEFRVRAFINDATDYSEVFSDVITISFTPYDASIIVKPIYLLGSGTTVGWDNTKAIPMAYIGSGKFALVSLLTPGSGQYIKFISVLGAWAPQWGTDATGTAESGPLVYRPDEGVPDPPAIPVGATAGSYYIMADTANLLYETYLTSGELYVVGDATTAGWDAAAAIQLTESSPHVFTLVTTLNAAGGMKFLEVPGQWAPQWGTNAQGTGSKGMLVYRPTEAVPDPPSIPAPGSAGQYKITVDMTTMQYLIEAQ